MTLLELVELLTDELGLDLSSDSIDGSRTIWAVEEGSAHLRPLQHVELDQDGDLILEFGG